MGCVAARALPDWMVGWLIRCVARFAILVVGMIETDAAPGADDMAARALPRPVILRCVVTGQAIVHVGMVDFDKVPVIRGMAVAAQTQVVINRRLVTGQAVDQLGMIDRQHDPIVGGMAI